MCNIHMTSISKKKTCVHVVNRIQIMFILVRAIEKTLIYKLDDMLYALKGF